MLRRILSFFLLFFITYSYCNGQCSTLGQTPSTAFPVCGQSVFTQTQVPQCSNGIVPVPCTDGIDYVDYNPYWYKFTCYESGTLGFLIKPEDLNDDYDWQLFDITGRSADDVFKISSLFVTGNWSGTYGETGTSQNSTNNISCASNPSSGVSTFSKMPDIIEGHNYLLVVSHFSGSDQSGYELSFTGGTGSITDPVKPQALSAKINCSGETISMVFNKNLKCSSLAKDGSDFRLSSSASKIISASSINCSSGFDMDSVAINLDNPLPPGDYKIIVQKGGDRNTLLDNCDASIPENSEALFKVEPSAPTAMDSITPVQCAPAQLELVFNNRVLCGSVASNGSDFSISGPFPVKIMSASGDNCSGGASTKIILKLDKPIQNAGIFTITLQQGSDGNTILDECTRQTPAGSQLSFTTADTVSAFFNYSVRLGCDLDTLFYTHDGRNSVNEWNWTFDKNGTGNTRDSFFTFNDYGSKRIQLNCSNGVCTDSSAIDILLDNELVSKFYVSPSAELCPEDVAQFIDSSTGNIISWYWIFGDGRTSTLQLPEPKHYAAPLTRNGSSYPTALIVKNNLGCFDTSHAVIKLLYNCYIDVPGAFTPNGDGLNDFLYPLNAYKADDLEFRVFNRWGQLIFETKDWTHKWDGKLNGQPQPAATYVWMLRYKHRDTGTIFSLKGTTVLIR